jgi:uncharacterized protein YnzC (UPF0291/DUF896 family)
MSTLSSLSEQIYDTEFYFRSDLIDSRYSSPEQARAAEVILIQDWLDAHLGEMNILLNTSFTSSSGDVTGLEIEEQNILREMYMYNYYRKQSRNLLRSIDGTTLIDIDFQTIREGDSVITRAVNSKQEVVKNYRMLMLQAQDNLDKLVHKYNMYRAKPSQVTGDDAKG